MTDEDYAHALAHARLVAGEAPPPAERLSLAAGYAIQARAAPLLGTPVGWKVGATSAGAMAFLGVAEPIRGRLFAERVFADGAAMRLGDGVEAEPEIALVLARDLGVGGDPLAAVGRACFAIEFVRPTRADAFEQGPGFIVADNAAGLAALLGPEVPLEALAEPAALRAELRVEGGAATAGSADAVLGDPLRALSWLAGSVGGLAAGELVLTGAMARSVPAPPGPVVLDCGRWGRAAARIAAV